jgi:MEMO1 family protein
MIVFSAITPHPPIIIPSIGKQDSLNAVKDTIKAMESLASSLHDSKPDTIVVISPHAPMDAHSFAINESPTLTGELSRFGSSETLSFSNDLSLSLGIANAASDEQIPVSTHKSSLDHGTIVPLYFLAYNSDVNIVHLSFSLLDADTHFSYGKIIGDICRASDKRVAIVASGDLSHKLLQGAPAGFSPYGAQFDDSLVEYLKKGSVKDILSFDKSVVEGAGECGLRSIVMLLGALDNMSMHCHVMNYEGPFGVGYLVAKFSKEPAPVVEAKPSKQQGLEPHVALAKSTIEEYVTNQKTLEMPTDLPEDFYSTKKGVFVTLFKDKQLRGCIGTFSPATENIAQETIRNAISACSRDPRFPAVTPQDLPHLEYEVSLLEKPEALKDISTLDPKKYGIIIGTNDGRRGLLLPNLDTVETVEQQLSIACQKGGINPQKDEILLWKFTVTKYSQEKSL